jgi:transcriptional regulator with XRE-family HTH domain
MPARRPASQKPSPMQRKLGQVIRATRQQLGYSQERLAELSELSTNYVGSIERGEYDVTVTTLHRMASALKCKASDITRAAGY